MNLKLKEIKYGNCYQYIRKLFCSESLSCMRMKKIVKSRMTISVCVVDVKCRTGLIIWLGSVLWDVVNIILEGKSAEVRNSVRWSGRFKEHVEADVMYMECGVLSVAGRPITERATVFSGENSEPKILSNAVERRCG